MCWNIWGGGTEASAKNSGGSLDISCILCLAVCLSTFLSICLLSACRTSLFTGIHWTWLLQIHLWCPGQSGWVPPCWQLLPGPHQSSWSLHINRVSSCTRGRKGGVTSQSIPATFFISSYSLDKPTSFLTENQSIISSSSSHWYELSSFPSHPCF